MEKNYESVKLACQIRITYNLITNKSIKYKRKFKHGPKPEDQDKDRRHTDHRSLS